MDPVTERQVNRKIASAGCRVPRPKANQSSGKRAEWVPPSLVFVFFGVLTTVIAMSSGTESESSLCLECGICCDGTLFSNVQLKKSDDASRLRAFGLPLRRRGDVLRFPQPCAALCGKACSLYKHRPSHCRDFDCLTLTRLREKQLTQEQALKIIRRARRLADRIDRELKHLGEEDTKAPLKLRFARVSRAMGSNPESYTRQASGKFGDISQQMHQLHLMLSEHFFQ